MKDLISLTQAQLEAHIKQLEKHGTTREVEEAKRIKHYVNLKLEQKKRIKELSKKKDNRVWLNCERRFVDPDKINEKQIEAEVELLPYI